MAKEKRFELILTEGSMMDSGWRYVIVDKETGVQYLLWKNGDSGGATPLLDRDGKPLLYK